MTEQLVWQRHELAIFDKLLEYRDGLVRDYMAGFSNLPDAVLAQSENSVDPKHYDDTAMSQAEGMLVTRDPATLKWSTNFEAWKSVGIRNLVKQQGNVVVDEQISNEDAVKYPTAMQLLDDYRDDLFGLVYSAIGPYSILQRHVGPENIEGEYIRIHLPLIIPSGDIFLEVQGQEVEWTDIFGFNNQYLHSAHNYSNDWRLIMIIDLSRKACGLPPGRYYSEGGQERDKPFVRGWTL